jgi:hypothetical protein
MPLAHPLGEHSERAAAGPSVVLDTFAGRVHVEWEPAAPVTALGHLPFFVEFLKHVRQLGGGLSAALYQPECAEGARRVGNDGAVDPGRPPLPSRRCAGMASTRACWGWSEDAVRRALKKMPETDAEVWLRRHLDETPLPLLGVPWILDVDTTVKPLFGHQEGAGYNPHKPGRPSHTLHTDWVAGLRRVLEVKAGNEPSSAHSAPALWRLLDRLGRDRWPWLLRGDADFGTERIMSRAEPEGVPYRFKLRSTRTVKRLIEKAMGEADWTAAGQGWQGKASTLRLQGWSRHRRILRRRLAREVLVTDRPRSPTGVVLCRGHRRPRGL